MIVRGLMIAALLMAAGPGRADPPTAVLGLVETVRLLPEAIDINAKVDTGAQHSSVDIATWAPFERAGQTWIRFVLRLDNDRQAELERPLVRMARIGQAGTIVERPVVRITLCVGGTAREADVNLSVRPKRTHRMLLGASFLYGAFLVDVSRRNLTLPACTGGKP